MFNGKDITAQTWIKGAYIRFQRVSQISLFSSQSSSPQPSCYFLLLIPLFSLVAFSRKLPKAIKVRNFIPKLSCSNPVWNVCYPGKYFVTFHKFLQVPLTRPQSLSHPSQPTIPSPLDILCQLQHR